MLLLSRSEVEALLDPRELIDAVAAAMADLSAGRASVPPRVAAHADGALFVMAAHVPAAGALTAKLVTLYPQNAGGPLHTHQAVIAAFDPATGEPVAVLDGTGITAQRTAAASALSVRLLARQDARVLAVVGTGVQARAHARCVRLVRAFAHVVVAGRSPERVAALVDELAAAGVPARAAATVEEAVRGADVVCACTHAEAPVVQRAWLAPGTHVTSVGYHPQGRELGEDVLRDALVVVESRAAALAPVPSGSNDLRGLGPDDVTELGELVAGARPGRCSADQVTVYKSVGVAVQDAAATALVLAQARERGAGRQVALAE